MGWKPPPAAVDDAGAPMKILAFLLIDVFRAQLSLEENRHSVPNMTKEKQTKVRNSNPVARVWVSGETHKWEWTNR